MLRFFLLAILITGVFITGYLEIFTSESVHQTQADNKERLKLEYDAVRSIHRHLDDDKDGDVDVKESKEFLQDELNLHDNKRHSKFHSGDGSISVEELWKAWSNSEVCKWTTSEVVDWLKNVVHLPQYTDVFTKKQINGRHLPSLTSDNDILLNELKISNVIDRKKIALRAMDAVLFGVPKVHNYLKDLVLGLAVSVAMAGFWFSNVQKRKAQKQMETMMKDVEFLQQAEKNLTGLQNRLHEAEASHQVIQQEKYQLESNLKNEIETAKCEAQRLREAREDESGEIHTRLKLAEQELFQVSEALRKAEKELEYFSYQMTSSLKQWLQITYQKEVKNYIHRRAVALRKMESAKEACDRINKKRNSVFGSLRLVHDQNIDEVDEKILSARTALAEVTNELEELQHRWQQIETCCRLDICVSSSFVLDATDSSSSSLGQAILALGGKVGTLGSVKSNSRESLGLRRVVTCPSLQPPNDSRSYHGVSKSTLARDAKAYSYETLSKVASATDECECESPDGVSQNASSSENMKNAQSECMNCDHLDAECEKPITPTPLSANSSTSDLNISGSTETKKKSNGENGTTEVSKTKKNSDKFFLRKKKWWSRNKRHHSLETDPESETDSVQDNNTRSLPILPRTKDSKKQSDNDDIEHPLSH